jgi:arginyl-tRNA synthetase
MTVERPRDSAHGDYATNVALQTGNKVGVSAREFAGWLADALAQHPGVRTAEVAGPGFLNLRLGADAQGELIAQVLAAGERFGAGQDLVGKAVAAALGEARATAVTMENLVEAVGVDAARYALIRSPHASPIDIDLELWSQRTNDNPVFFVQYAHARLASLARNAADLGISSRGAQLGLLVHEREGQLIRTLGDFPRVVALAEQLREPHRVARYLEQLAEAYHRFSDTCRVLPMGDEQPGPPHTARLALSEATRQVLANGLGLLGVSAPERM